ncbi:hypothetical protein CAT67_13370 [Acinetobacter baumannii]|uniref:hypothetical protein n=1 Tax=Acinetobacter baumannii TaxID=470 RepID=UPI0002CED8FA|nr:hypothetical protein [Acinetobacter baumannii]ENW47468.1 hypothetical protein F919_00223 [Acinetobacter baumannii NIPH 329]OTT99577.1 hypothetical protein CAT67_13370 [Acinetobacter baumannii]HDX6159361.1 hypothetical protein [Acinetobacter baumannii]
MMLSFEEKKEQLVNVLKELAKREFSYIIAAETLRKNGFTGNGYPRFINKIRSLDENEINEKNITNSFLELRDILNNYIKFGNKKITIFRFNSSELNTIQTNLESSLNFLSYRKEDFDLLENSEVNRSYQFKTSLETDDSIYYYFNIDRNYYERQVVTDENRMNEIGGVLHLQHKDEIFKVITYTKVWVTAFDFIKVDYKNSIVVLGQDLSTLLDKTQRNKDYANLTVMLANCLGIHPTELKALDLKPALSKFENEKLGRIVEHQFSSSNQKFNHSTKVSALEDVRDDNFYKTGNQKEKLDYFGICKNYNEKTTAINVTLTIRLPLKLYNASPLNPIYEALIDDALSLESFEYGIERIIEKL